jgi:flagellar motor switch protein FliM
MSGQQTATMPAGAPAAAAGGDPAASCAPKRLPPPPPAGRNARAGGERMPMLDVIIERLGKLLQGSLRRLAGDGISISIDPPASLRMGEYLQTLPSPALLCITRFEGNNAPALAVAGADLVFSAVELFLGGAPLSAEARPQRAFSAVERTLAERMVRIVLADLATAFQPIAEAKLRLDRIETLPKFAAVVRESAGVIVITIHVQMEGRSGRLQLVLPLVSLEPVRDALRQSYPGEKLGRDALWEQHLTQELLASGLRLSAVLDEPTIGLSDLMRWKVGSTLALDVTPASPVKIYCGKSPVFRGSMGRHHDRVVVRIDGRVEG